MTKQILVELFLNSKIGVSVLLDVDPTITFQEGDLDKRLLDLARQELRNAIGYMEPNTMLYEWRFV